MSFLPPLSLLCELGVEFHLCTSWEILLLCCNMNIWNNFVWQMYKLWHHNWLKCRNWSIFHKLKKCVYNGIIFSSLVLIVQLTHRSKSHIDLNPNNLLIDLCRQNNEHLFFKWGWWFKMGFWLDISKSNNHATS